MLSCFLRILYAIFYKLYGRGNGCISTDKKDMKKQQQKISLFSNTEAKKTHIHEFIQNLFIKIFCCTFIYRSIETCYILCVKEIRV